MDIQQNIKIDSQCKYALVARGDAGVYLRFPVDPTYREKIWDHAPGMLIVEEAGGYVTDMDGLRLDFSKGRLLQSKGIICSSSKKMNDKILDYLGSNKL